ncbi:MAG: DUF2061 domain-containing protein [Sneathiellaceae bacterium]
MLLDAALTPMLVRRETRRRSLLKTLTWRITATADTFAISWVVTGSLVFAGSIASVEVATKMVIYYLHERAWARVPWGWVTELVQGRDRHPDAVTAPAAAPKPAPAAAAAARTARGQGRLEEVPEPVEQDLGPARPDSGTVGRKLRQAVGGK